MEAGAKIEKKVTKKYIIGDLSNKFTLNYNHGK
jgi:hypothetical protein